VGRDGSNGDGRAHEEVAARRAELPEALRRAGGRREGASRDAAREVGVPEAEAYGVASFFHLLARPDAALRVCTGLSCRLAGAEALLAAAREADGSVEECSCLAACDAAPAVLRGREVVPDVSAYELSDLLADGADASGADRGRGLWRGAIGPTARDDARLALHLDAEPEYAGEAFARARDLGRDAVLSELEAAGLQGRGGAGFPAHVKWRAVCDQPDGTRYVVANADEAEPGTFKDRELMVRRPDLVLEGLAIAAWAVGADQAYVYLRGEFALPRRVLEGAIEQLAARSALPGVAFHLHSGHGAYICGEETALLEALEGKRGMPRLRPPLPVESGLWGRPTLVQNVETLACVPPIVLRGGERFRALGRTEAGTKLYAVSGHVVRPGVYELPLGVSLDELAHAAGGYAGELKAFSPGGASSGFLPASERARPLDFAALAEAGSDMRWAVLEQLRFFERESCGQCAPCRIGTRYLREAVDANAALRGLPGASGPPLAAVDDVAWQMVEGSICGLGQAAPAPLTSALKHFPEEFLR
jgi:NADH:ubiquinone oxidoreductase subunit F (NADH-binding)